MAGTGMDPRGFSLNIPGAGPFLPVARQVAVRAASMFGAGKTEAANAGRAVEIVVHGIVDHAFAAGSGAEIEVRFSADPGRLTVEFRFATAGDGALERGLSASGGVASAIDDLNRLVDRIEFECEGGSECCRLMCGTTGA